MRIDKKSLLFGILLLGLATNFFVLYNVQFLYLRAITSFIFLTTIPGLLIMLILKIGKISFWEYLVYSIGLSVGFIIFLGLAINWILPWLTITDKPLSLIPLQISFNIILAILWLIAFYRNKNTTSKYNLPKFERHDILLSIISVFVPLISIFGAMTLNNGGSNILALVNYALICVSIFVVYIFRQHVNNRTFPFFILMIAISLLLSGWLRSDYISGSDINHEFQVFQVAKENHIWKITDYYNAYNSCLSLNILPTVLSTFLNINDQYIFKIIIPIIFSSAPLIVYLISKHYLVESLSLLAAFFFMSQPTFTSWTLTPIRQEVAFTLFSISILILHDKNIDSTIRKLLFIVFSISMIVSHYSTAYMAIAIYALSYIAYKVSKYIGRNKNINNYYPSILSLKTLIVLLGFTYIWYSQITVGFSNITLFLNNGVKNVGNIFTSSVQAQGQSVFDQLNIFSPRISNQEILSKYIDEMTLSYKLLKNPDQLYSLATTSKYDTNISTIQGVSPKFNYGVLYSYIIVRNAFKLLGEFLIILGVVYFALVKKYRQKGILYLNSAALIIMILATITPFISIDYDLVRTYQQILIVLPFTAVVGLLALSNFFKTKKFHKFTSIFFLLYLLLLSRFFQQFIGGPDISMVFNNIGSEYSMYYTHKSEIFSGQWLWNNRLSNIPIFADNYSNTKLRLTSTSPYKEQVTTDILPTTITKDGYVYLNSTNVLEQVAIKPYKGITLTYNYPNMFLADNKNLIYNNGSSEIFK